MLQPATLAFLADLQANNAKPWFDAHRKPYEAARADFVALVTDVLADLQAADPAIAASNLQAKKAVFRINRDVRFSADKSPYKTNFGAWLNAGGRQAPTAGYYLNIQPGGSFVAGGLYMPDAKLLAAIRQEIDYDLPVLEQLLAAPDFRRYFNGLSPETSLQRPPKGYDAANPALPYLKLRSFTAVRPLPDAEVLAPTLRAQVADAFRSLHPLVAFLNRAVEG
ncbi:DUF2461 domain-containing protein [Hymenobacter busanensis]|uniref:DUF2461 domain-containing protein n=1 Tax=Hymenobacter busanensis TaxID=2607656 RepID=A0A7L5A0Q7_9BACT|nr:DUF2461 domain-containing protein [Hymenobacter busanensis]KAA9338452.1 DUF2461 domain-containing protein [Hymenobacter busanensis]QHJ09121.1 TIGR02453 family protein [Hymenobacter busanensis]